jgi:cyclopropane fatty-acyl-phospholipid synthase-like methyltransferase
MTNPINDLKDLYSDSKKNKNKEHIDKLFPNIKDGCINFGYWNSYSIPISLHTRIHSQKALYEKVFSKLDLVDDKKILEIGFGRGHGMNWLNNKKLDLYGIDAFIEHVNYAKKSHPELINKFHFGEAEKIPFKNTFFDSIFSIEAAQHFNSFKKFAEESYRVLNSQGVLCISTYFFTSEESKKNVEKYIPNTIEGTHNAISIDEAKKYLIDANFIIEEIQPIGKKVFPAYAQWQKQQFNFQNELRQIAKDKKWENYFVGGGNQEHPWLIAYNNNWVNYYIIKGKKNDQKD